MRGIDIIEAMNGIDEDMIRHARFHRRRAPAWLRWTSMASVFLGVAILAAVLLGRLMAGPVGTHADPNKPDILAPEPVPPAETSVDSQREPEELYTSEPSPSPSDISGVAVTPEPAVSNQEPLLDEAAEDNSLDSAADYGLEAADPLPSQERISLPGEFAPPEDDFLRDETLFNVGGVTFAMDDTDVIALLGEPDSTEETQGKYRWLYYGSLFYEFEICDTCGAHHLQSIHEETGGSRLYPYGLTLDDSMSDVLGFLNASALDTTQFHRIYTIDGTHYAEFETLIDNPQLHFLDVRVGCIMWAMAFGRQNQLYINNIELITDYTTVHDAHMRLAGGS